MVEHDPPPLIDIYIDCPKCQGKGRIEDEWPLRVNRPGESQMVTCPKCGGAGEMEIQVCSRCRELEYRCFCWIQQEKELMELASAARD